MSHWPDRTWRPDRTVRLPASHCTIDGLCRQLRRHRSCTSASGVGQHRGREPVHRPGRCCCCYILNRDFRGLHLQYNAGYTSVVMSSDVYTNS